MAFQSQVNLGYARGVAGSKASFNPFVYWPNNLLADGPVAVGSFVWPGTAPQIQAKNTGTGVPIGIVERNIVYPNFLVFEEGTLIVPDGSALATVIKGDLWVVSLTAATDGQKVYANLADGTIQTDAAGETITGAVETPWVVVSGGAAGDPILISNWSN